jgi:hypothetical protein
MRKIAAGRDQGVKCGLGVSALIFGFCVLEGETGRGGEGGNDFSPPLPCPLSPTLLFNDISTHDSIKLQSNKRTQLLERLLTDALDI